jgi:ribokinase
MSRILVVGSSNTDMVINVADIPVAGQTLMGDEFATFAGGKGANQAVAARRAGAEVSFIAAVGDDSFGDMAVKGFVAEGIDTQHIEIISNMPSGVALIFVSHAGENCIGVAPGANNCLTPELIEQHRDLFGQVSHVLVQLETPLETVSKVVEVAGEYGVKVILNPAPAPERALPKTLLQQLYCITPNETEAELLTGINVIDVESATLAARHLISQGVKNVVMTLGAQGALMVNQQTVLHLAAPEVKVVDTTAAGDTFNGVLVCALAEGLPLVEAITLSVQAASLSVQNAGAIASIPFRKQYQ